MGFRGQDAWRRHPAVSCVCLSHNNKRVSQGLLEGPKTLSWTRHLHRHLLRLLRRGSALEAHDLRTQERQEVQVHQRGIFKCCCRRPRSAGRRRGPRAQDLEISFCFMGLKFYNYGRRTEEIISLLFSANIIYLLLKWPRILLKLLL